MDTIRHQLHQIDTNLLFGIACRIIDVQTVQDAHEFAQKIQEAAQIVTEAALRIAGIDTNATTRSLQSPDYLAIVAAVVGTYEIQQEPGATT